MHERAVNDSKVLSSMILLDTPRYHNEASKARMTVHGDFLEEEDSRFLGSALKLKSPHGPKGEKHYSSAIVKAEKTLNKSKNDCDRTNRTADEETPYSGTPQSRKTAKRSQSRVAHEDGPYETRCPSKAAKKPENTVANTKSTKSLLTSA